MSSKDNSSNEENKDSSEKQDKSQENTSSDQSDMQDQIDDDNQDNVDSDEGSSNKIVDEAKKKIGESKDEARDLALDAVPVLGQANRIRAEHKRLNDMKNDAKEAAGMDTSEDDISDKIADTGEKVVNTGEKAAVASAAADVGSKGIIGLLAVEFILRAQAMALALLSGITSAITSAVSAIAGFVSSAIGVSVAAAQVVAVAVLVGTIGLPATVVLVTAFALVTDRKDDSSAVDCVADTTQPSISDSDQEFVDGGADNAQMQEVKDNVYSILKAYGGDDVNIAGFFGNIQAESGFDPTAIETVKSYTSDENFGIGPRKQMIIDADFSAKSTKAFVGGTPYHKKYPTINRVGIGLQQWTDIKSGGSFQPDSGGRNTALREYADAADKEWYDEALQIQFMLEGDEGNRPDEIKAYFEKSFGSADEAARYLQKGWIGNPTMATEERKSGARKAMLDFENMNADEDYGDSILSGLGVDRATGNTVAASYQEDDGCGNKVADHYNSAPDGTGSYSSDLVLNTWRPDDLPSELRKFAKDPRDVGLGWKDSKGWYPGIQTDQCVGLASSYFTLIYPDWDEDGRSPTRPHGNGHTTAKGWADHYDEMTNEAPAQGAVFSDATTSAAGHTGIVQHVFANGDILIVETNIGGASGQGNGETHTWSYRVIKKDSYIDKNWTFFKPKESEPIWSKD